MLDDNKEIIAQLGKHLIKERTAEDIVVCAIEEMSELTQILTKYLRGSKKFTEEKLCEEFAHASLMLDAVSALFVIDDVKADEERVKALKKCFGI